MDPMLGIAMAAMTPMTAMTTSISTRLKPLEIVFLIEVFFMGIGILDLVAVGFSETDQVSEGHVFPSRFSKTCGNYKQKIKKSKTIFIKFMASIVLATI